MQAEIESRFVYSQVDLFASNLSARKLSFLETRPTQLGDGCSGTKLVSSIRTHPICFPSFSLYSKSFTQDRAEPSPYNDTCSASLSIIANNSQCSHHTSYGKSTTKCTKRDSSISDKENIKGSSLESFRDSLIDLGLSESATSLISSAKKAKFKLKLQFTLAKTG